MGLHRVARDEAQLGRGHVVHGPRTIVLLGVPAGDGGIDDLGALEVGQRVLPVAGLDHLAGHRHVVLVGAGPRPGHAALHDRVVGELRLELLQLGVPGVGIEVLALGSAERLAGLQVLIAGLQIERLGVQRRGPGPVAGLLLLLGGAAQALDLEVDLLVQRGQAGLVVLVVGLGLERVLVGPLGVRELALGAEALGVLERLLADGHATRRTERNLRMRGVYDGRDETFQGTRWRPRRVSDGAGPVRHRSTGPREPCCAPAMSGRWLGVTAVLLLAGGTSACGGAGAGADAAISAPDGGGGPGDGGRRADDAGAPGPDAGGDPDLGAEPDDAAAGPDDRGGGPDDARTPPPDSGATPDASAPLPA